MGLGESSTSTDVARRDSVSAKGGPSEFEGLPIMGR
jgi:hypothetical protein